MRSQSTDSRTIVNYNELLDMTCEELIAVTATWKEELNWCHFEASRQMNVMHKLLG